MKSLTKGLLKQRLVRWGLMLSPVWVVLLVMAIRAYAVPAPSYRVLFYPNCSPAWAGGTIWQQGIDNPTPSSGIPTGPYCGSPAYIPGFMPQIIGTDTRGVVVIDTTTNYCGAGDIYLGFAYTEVTHDNISWTPVFGSTNAVLMPNGYTETKWPLVGKNIFGYGAVLVLGPASPMIFCPGGVGTGGQ